MERGAELSVQGQHETDSSFSGTGNNRGGGAHSAAGGVGDGYTIDDASTPYGSIYAPTTRGASGGEGGAGGSTIKIDAAIFQLDGILNANGADSETGGGGSGGSVYVVARSFDGLGTIKAEGGVTTQSNAGNFNSLFSSTLTCF